MSLKRHILTSKCPVIAEIEGLQAKFHNVSWKKCYFYLVLRKKALQTQKKINFTIYSSKLHLIHVNVIFDCFKKINSCQFTSFLFNIIIKFYFSYLLPFCYFSKSSYGNLEF